MGLFQTFSDDGGLQLDCDLATYFMRAKGQASTTTRTVGNSSPSSLTITLPPGYVLPFVAVQCAAGKIGLLRTFENSDGSVSYAYVSDAPVGSTVNYWVFDNPVALSPSNGGVTLFDDQGRVTYSSDYGPMMAVDVLALGAEPGSFYDRPWAPLQASSTRPGRSLAFAQSCYGGHRNKGMLVAYGASGPTRPEPGRRYTWRFANDGKLYGARADGDTVTMGAISFDDVSSTVGTNITETEAQSRYDAILDFVVRGIGLVVDVTNL